ncbi:MAG: PKD domain-containing protein [Xanthomonadales bacterium]|jgi:DNA-binding beta-propeller fold protein YncE|nr:PKD domain-containing protein [Xanthomonadales bacterium]
MPINALPRLLSAATVMLAAGAAAQPTTTEWPTGIGFPNVPRTEGQLLAGPFAVNDGRGAILAWHHGILFSVPEAPASNPGSNLQVRMWNLMDPTQPRIIVNAPANAQGSLGTTQMPINAHGYFFVGQHMQTGAAGPFLVIGADWPPETPWSFRAQSGVPGVTRQASGHLGAGVRGSLQQPWHIEQTYWSYGAVSGPVQIYTNGPPGSPGSTLQATIDHLGLTGVIGHPFLLGNLLIYASDQSRTGVATYDLSNPQQPQLLDVLKTGGPGGYWPELWANDGELYIVLPYNDNGNGMRVVDATDPGNLRFVADVPLPRPNGSSGAMYAQFQDEFGFIGDHKIDMRTRQSVRQFATLSNGVDMSQFALPVGNLLVTGGVGSPGQGLAIYAHQAAPDTRPPSVAFSIPRPGQTQYPLGAPISLIIHETLDTTSIVNGSSFRVRRVLSPGNFGSPLAGRWTLSFDDILTFQPNAPLESGVSYEVRLEGIRDAAGNAMPAYAYTFSTGSSVGGNRPPQIQSHSATPYPAAPAAAVSFSATATDPDGDALEYRFDFGDGSPRTVWSATASAQHSYAQPGHYRASVQVRDPSGVMVSRSRVVTVLTPLPAARPTASAPILCDAPGRRVWTVNPDSNTISALDADTLAKLAEHPTCADPRAIARTPGGELWVACHDDDRIRVHHETTGAVIATIDTGYGSAPVGLAISPDGASAYVTLANRGELRRYSTATRQQTGALALGPQPRGIAVSADGSRVLVSRFLSPLHHGEVWDVSAASMSLTRTIRIPKFGGDANRDTTSSGRGVANQLAAVAISPRSGRAYVPATKPNSERGTLTHASQGLDPDNTVRNLLVELDPDAATPAQRFRRGLDLDNSDSASHVAFSPLGDYLLVTLQGMNELLVLDALALDASTGLGALVTRIGVGAAPQGVCTDPTTRRSYVHNFMGRSVSVLETDALYTAGSINVPVSTVAMVAAESLPATVLQGKRLFHHAGDPRMSAEGYLSCASCHLDGGDDGRVWDFTNRGEGLRNTTVLNGRGGLAHGRVHWSANFDEIQDFEIDIRNAFGGTGFLSNADFAASSAPLGAPKAGRNADLDALAAYVGSLGSNSLPRSPHRQANGQPTALGAQGQTIFQREGCASCHTPPRYTASATASSTLQDVGTLRASSGQRLGGPLTGIDPPTLLGVFASAPYFHDGSAATLADVFRVSGGITLPAENGTPLGGAQLINTFVDLNNDDTVRGRAYVQLEGSGQILRYSGVNGGAGGTGAIELRYSNSRSGAQTQALTVTVNGVALPVINLPASDNDPSFRTTHWSVLRLDGIALNAGTTNTVEFSTNNWYVAIDEILVANAGHLAQATPHRRVSTLPQAERDALLAFLRELDSSSAVAPLPEGVFANGFEM